MFEDHADALKWNQRYQSKTLDPAQPPNPCSLLSEQSHLLPNQGTALDLACGLGGNSIYLAKAGLRVSALDISQVALDKLSDAAKTLALPIETHLVDIERSPLPNNHFDCIVVSYFLDRDLCDTLSASLKPGGVLFYQTFSKHKLSTGGPSSDRFLLDNNELLLLFPDLIVRYYQDYAACGTTSLGDRNTAQLVAQKPN